MSEFEHTSAGLQIVIPGCERRTLPRSTTRVDEIGQGLLSFYKPPTLRERLASCTIGPQQGAEGTAEKRSIWAPIVMLRQRLTIELAHLLLARRRSGDRRKHRLIVIVPLSPETVGT
jgi:hypothetical protein